MQTFADKMLGVMAWCMPLFVAASTFGSLNAIIFTAARYMPMTRLLFLLLVSCMKSAAVVTNVCYLQLVSFSMIFLLPGTDHRVSIILLAVLMPTLIVWHITVGIDPFQMLSGSNASKSLSVLLFSPRNSFTSKPSSVRQSPSQLCSEVEIANPKTQNPVDNF